jgi:hypothetical protein
MGSAPESPVRNDSPVKGARFEPSVHRQKEYAFRDFPVQLDPSRAACLGMLFMPPERAITGSSWRAGVISFCVSGWFGDLVNPPLG